MSYRIDWTFSAQNSYFEEIEFHLFEVECKRS